MGTADMTDVDCDTKTATIEATPREGYRFVKWNDEVMDNPRTITVTQNTTFTAMFTKTDHHYVTVKRNYDDRGSVSGEGAYQYNTQATIEATPNEGYRFARWEDGGTNNPRTITVTQDTAFTAVFAPADGSFYVTVSRNNDGWGTVTGGGAYSRNTKATITAAANDGYRFSRWNDGSTDNSRTVTVTQDTAFTAEFMVNNLAVSGTNFDNPKYVAWVGNTLTFRKEGTYTVSMRSGVTLTTVETIKVENGNSNVYSITLDNVNIDVSGTGDACAFSIVAGAAINLTLAGSSTLKSGDRMAGLQAPTGATLTVGGSGSLAATGGVDGAGVGGGSGAAGGDITITGGTVTATGGTGGAGIGGGSGAAGGDITISGGTVTATGGTGSAGIGGGSGAAGGDITISGGTVTATGGDDNGSSSSSSDDDDDDDSGSDDNGDGSSDGDVVTATGGAGTGGAGIGGGSGKNAEGRVTITGGSVMMRGQLGPQPTNGAGSNVYLNTLTIGNANTLITEGSIDGKACDTTAKASTGVYGIRGVKTDAKGKVYLYLKKASTPEVVRLTDAGGASYYNRFPRAADNDNAVTLVRSATIVAVTPTGVGVAVDSSVTVTFSHAMNTSRAGRGTVMLNDSTLRDGDWSEDWKTFTAPYSGLIHGEEYAIHLFNFRDLAGNILPADNSQSFTTSGSAGVAGIKVVGASIEAGKDGSAYVVDDPAAKTVTVLISPEDKNAKVYHNDREVDSITLDVSHGGTQEVSYTVMSYDSVQKKSYTLTVEQRLDFDTCVRLKGRNVLICSKSLLEERGYTVVGICWYGNGEPLAENFYYALSEKWMMFDPNVVYHFEIETTDGLIRSTSKTFDFSTEVAVAAGSQRLTAYPNPLPSGAMLTVYVGEWGVRADELLIYNASGSLVLRQRFSGAFVTLPFAVPAGVYFLRVGSRYGKIVVK